MKFALVSGTRQEAQPGLTGECIGCGSPMVARCGEVRIKHWAHKGRIRCNPWWEPETEWHRAWKNQFPSEWQEIVHFSESGEKHIADVKTGEGWVLEFQHSYITPEERAAREDFYKTITWVVDGLRSAQSQNRFLKALERDAFTNRHFPELKAISSKVELLKTWVTSNCHVIFDFGGDLLWWLFPESDDSWSYLVSIPRHRVMNFHHQPNSTELNSFIEKYTELLSRRGSFPSLADYYHFENINRLDGYNKANLSDE